MKYDKEIINKVYGEKYRQLIEAIGEKNFMIVVEYFQGTNEYFGIKKADIKNKHNNLIKDFNGFNFRELGKKYGYSSRRVIEIVDTDEWKLKRKAIFNNLKNNFNGSNLEKLFQENGLSDEQIKSMMFNYKKVKNIVNKYIRDINIIKYYNENNCSYTDVANKFDLSYMTVYGIINYRRVKEGMKNNDN